MLPLRMISREAGEGVFAQKLRLADFSSV